MASLCERPIVGAVLAMVIVAALHVASEPAAALCRTTSHASTATNEGLNGMLIDTDMGQPVVYLLKVTSDQLVTVDLSHDPLYPGGMPLHALILPDARKAYLTTGSDADHPATIMVLRLGAIDWAQGCAELTIVKVLTIEAPGAVSSFAVPAAGSVRQPVVRSKWAPGNQQLHGPTLHPSGKYVCFTRWTDNQVRWTPVLMS